MKFNPDIVAATASPLCAQFAKASDPWAQERVTCDRRLEIEPGLYDIRGHARRAPSYFEHQEAAARRFSEVIRLVYGL